MNQHVNKHGVLRPFRHLSARFGRDDQVAMAGYLLLQSNTDPCVWRRTWVVVKVRCSSVACAPAVSLCVSVCSSVHCCDAELDVVFVSE